MEMQVDAPSEQWSHPEGDHRDELPIWNEPRRAACDGYPVGDTEHQQHDSEEGQSLVFRKCREGGKDDAQRVRDGVASPKPVEKVQQADEHQDRERVIRPTHVLKVEQSLEKDRVASDDEHEGNRKLT